MTKQNQTVQYDLGAENHGTFRGQTIDGIFVDSAKYGYGRWHGKFVATFHIDNGEWFVIPTNE